MTKTEKLNQLFDRWIAQFPKYVGKFTRDGIVNECIFEKQELKLLFVAKEPNNPGQKKEEDFRKWWAEGVRYSFSHRICEWAYGLLNNFPPLTSLSYNDEARIEVMKSIAFMNIKKSGGGPTANHEEILKALKRERDLLLEEINIIEPDIIIGGIGNTNYWKVLFPKIQFKETGFDTMVARVGRYKVVNFYHPSYRVPRAMSYSLLYAVSTSKVWKEVSV